MGGRGGEEVVTYTMGDDIQKLVNINDTRNQYIVNIFNVAITDTMSEEHCIVGNSIVVATGTEYCTSKRGLYTPFLPSLSDQRTTVRKHGPDITAWSMPSRHIVIPCRLV